MAIAIEQEGRHKWLYSIILRFSTTGSGSTQVSTTKHLRRLRKLLKVGAHFFEARSCGLDPFRLTPKFYYNKSGSLSLHKNPPDPDRGRPSTSRIVLLLFSGSVRYRKGLLPTEEKRIRTCGAQYLLYGPVVYYSQYCCC